jgi:hypothetical protein
MTAEAFRLAAFSFQLAPCVSADSSVEESERTDRTMRLLSLPPSNQDYFWVVVGWAVLYAVLKWLRTDGSNYSIKRFDDSFWPDAILIGWQAVYWPVSLASVI